MKINLNTPPFDMLIVGFLMIITLCVYISMQNTCDGDKTSAQRAAVKIQLSSFESVCRNYYQITGKVPGKLQDLVSFPGNVPNWKQLLEEIPKDPWNNDYLYTVQNNKVIISSEGSDMVLGEDLQRHFKLSPSVNNQTP